MAGKFEVKKASDGQFYFNLKASNGRVILTSERYTDKRSAQKGIESVRKNAGNAARFERKQRTGGQPYFILKASNGETIGSSETYSGTTGVTRGIASVQKTAPEAAVDDRTA
ncbi:MAG TPA: YegP family protein [Thermoanaerobaculia bacterium]|nr:YegP family protein [Thermoanaerobaculia bacterium]